MQTSKKVSRRSPRNRGDVLGRASQVQRVRASPRVVALAWWGASPRRAPRLVMLCRRQSKQRHALFRESGEDTWSASTSASGWRARAVDRHQTHRHRLCQSRAPRGLDQLQRNPRFVANRWAVGVVASHAKVGPSNWYHFQAMLLDAHAHVDGRPGVALGSRHRRLPPGRHRAVAAPLPDHQTFRRRRRHPAGFDPLATVCVKLVAAALRWVVLHLACRRRHRRTGSHGRDGLPEARRRGAGHPRLPTQAQTLRAHRHRRHRLALWHVPVVAGVGAGAAALVVLAIVTAPVRDRWTARRRRPVGWRCDRGGAVAGNVLRPISHHHRSATAGVLPTTA